MSSMTYQPYLEHAHPAFRDGTQRLFAFEGSPYGASVIQSKHSYGGESGLFELAVLKFDDERRQDRHFTVCYDTPITEDVIGWLTEEEVQATLAQIDRLGKEASNG